MTARCASDFALKPTNNPVGRAFLRRPAELSEATTTRSSVRSDNHQDNLSPCA